MHECARRNATPGAWLFLPMKKKPAKLWWIFYPLAVTLEAISNKARFGEWRFKAAHKTFTDGMQDEDSLEK